MLFRCTSIKYVEEGRDFFFNRRKQYSSRVGGGGVKSSYTVGHHVVWRHAFFIGVEYGYSRLSGMGVWDMCALFLRIIP